MKNKLVKAMTIMSMFSAVQAKAEQISKPSSLQHQGVPILMELHHMEVHQELVIVQGTEQIMEIIM